MCILTTEHYACACTIRTVAPCGSSSLSCDATHIDVNLYCACPDCQFDLYLAMEDFAIRMGRRHFEHGSCNEQRYGISTGKWPTTMEKYGNSRLLRRLARAARKEGGEHARDLAPSSRAGDWPPLGTLRPGSLEPAIGWANLERTRKHREEAEIKRNTQSYEVAIRRGEISRPVSRLNVSELSAQSARSPPANLASSSSLSSTESTPGTPSVFADLVAPEKSRKRKRSRTYSPHNSDAGTETPYTWRDLPPLAGNLKVACKRHEGARMDGFGYSRCEECRKTADDFPKHHPKAAELEEDTTRGDMKRKPGWKGYIPVEEVPPGEFSRVPKFDRRGVPIPDCTHAPVTRCKPLMRSQKRRRQE